MISDNSSTAKPKPASNEPNPLHFEPLEPRVLFDAAAADAPVADVSVAVVEEEFANEEVTFEVTFDNTGGSEGYAPYVDFVADPELEITGIETFGAEGENPAGNAVDPIGEIAADGQVVDINTGVPVDHPMYTDSSDGGTYGLAGSGTPPVQYDVVANPDLIGKYVYNVQLPFGSFTEGNPPATVKVTASLDTDNGIKPHEEVVAYAQGGFAYGCDALHNSGTDDPIVSGLSSDGVTPVVINLNKSAGVREGEGDYTGENVSGPNHPITYTLTVDLAEGEEVDDLVIQDLLPDDLAYTNSLTVTFGSGTGGTKNVTVDSEPELNTDGLTGVDPTDNELRLTVDNIVGNGGGDIIVTYTTFVPFIEADGTRVVDPTSGEEGDLADDEYNDASVEADYDWDGPGGDPSVQIGDNEGPMNPGTTLESFDADTDFRIEEHSIATQKSVEIAADGDRGVIGTLNSRDVLEYTIDFQISDYFAFTDVKFDDVLGDGQEFLPALDAGTTWANAGDFETDAAQIKPTFTFEMHGNTISVDFDEANFSATENADGTTNIQFDLYQQLVDDGFVTAGAPMLGGFVSPTGTAPSDLNPTTFNGGATTGTITYRVLTRDSFTTGTQDQVSQGDTLSNDVTVTGTNRDIETFAALDVVVDDSSSSISIPVGEVTKETVNIYSHGQSISLVDDNDPTTRPTVAVTPGDLVTYRITYDLPVSEFENLTLTDFVPLPIFDIDGVGGLALDTSQIYAYDATDSFQTPGRISFGPGDTFFGPDGPGGTTGIDADNPGFTSTAGMTPTISVDGDLNSFELGLGSYQVGTGNDPVSSRVEILITLQVQDGEFQDDLFFTNQVVSSEADTGGVTSTSNEISQSIISRPELNIKKGITAVTNPDGNFTAQQGPPDITFNAPGSATAWNSGTEPITSDALDIREIDADYNFADAGDLATFVIVVENTGTSTWGAFDVSLNDTIPAGMAIPTSGANLRVTLGDGTVLNAGTDYTGDLFNTPLELIDPAVDQGALEGYSGTSGRNILVVAYDLVIEDTAEANSTLVNTTEIETYSASEGGTDYADPGEHVDTAEIRISRPSVDKSIVSTSHTDTDNNLASDVTIGEVVTYSITMAIPEGTMKNVSIVDTLPDGMAFVGLDSVTFDGALTSDTGDLQTDVRAFYNADASTLSLGFNGAASAGLGDFTNSDQDNSRAETVTFVYRAVVLNEAVNDRDDRPTNTARISWTGGSRTDQATVTVVEPNVQVEKTVVGNVTTVEGAQEITYEIQLSNPQDANGNVSEAYDVELEDLLPEEVEYVSVTYFSGETPDVGSLSFDNSVGTEGAIRASWDRIGVGETATIRVTVRIDDGLPTGTAIKNEATAEYSSLEGELGDATYNGFDPATGFGPNANAGGSNPAAVLGVERTGDPSDSGGEANDYVAADDVTVTVLAPIGIDKAVVDTAEAHTDNDNSADGDVEVAIGEVVRYEVRIRVPQAENESIELVDTLDEDLFWIPAGTNDIQISLEGFTDNSSLTADADIEAAINGPDPIDTDRVSFDAANNRVTFDFGDITNFETDSDPEYIVISYNAIVRNDATVDRGDTLVNTAQVRVEGVNSGPEFTQEVLVVEPNLTIDKTDTAVTADAGDTITYTLTVRSDNDPNATRAFDIAVGDLVPDELEITSPLTFDFSGAPNSSTVSQSVVGQSISAVIDQLDPNESFTITFTASVRDTGANIIQAGETVSNRATLDYSSLPGSGTANNTGDNTTGNVSGTPGAVDGEREYEHEDTESFSAPGPIITKVLADPTDTTFTIGEPVEYVIRVTVPEGLTGDPDAYVLDSLESGFRFIPGSLTVTAGAGITVDVAGGLTEGNATFFTHTDPGDTALAETLKFDFNAITFNDGTAGNGLATQTIEIRYLAQVENIVANQAGGTLNNVADFFYTDDDGTTLNTVDDSTGDTDTIVTIVEPNVSTTKQVLNTPADANDTVEYQVNITSDGQVPAYDISVTDVMPTGVEIDVTTFSATLNGADVSDLFLVTTGGFTDNPGESIDLTVGQTIIVTYDAIIQPTIRSSVDLINEVDVEWTSLDDDNATDGIDAADTGERTGDGDIDNPTDPTNPNNYENEATATFTTDLTHGFIKEVFSTSADHTGTAEGLDATTDLTIGETVVYRLTATIGRGTTDGVQIVDQLSIANGLLDIRNVTISAGSSLTRSDGQPFDNNVAISDSLGSDGYFDRLVVDLGTVVNDPTGSAGPADEQIVILVEAVVVNNIANQDGDVINNRGDLNYLEDVNQDGTQTVQNLNDNVNIELVEPNVSTNKRLLNTPTDSNDVAEYEITITSDGESSAFDITVTDVMPAGVEIDLSTFRATKGGVDVSDLFIATSNGFTHNPANSIDLAVGESIIVLYDAVLQPTIRGSVDLINEVDVEWTSLDDDNLTDGGTALDPDERTGDSDIDNPADPTNPNNYEDEATATFTTDLTYGFTKEVLSTSADHTGTAAGIDATTDLTIGETVVYRLTATIGRGTTDGVQIIDQLSIANGLLDIRNVTVSAGSSLTRSDGQPFDNNVTISDSLGADGYNDRLVVDFGTLVNDPTGSAGPADEQIVILVEAVVVNNIANQDGDVINNRGDLNYLEDVNQDGTQTVQNLNDNVNIELVEPNVSTNKRLLNTPTDSNDVAEYEITITSDGEVAAFDVTVTDVMPAGVEIDLSTFQATKGGVDVSDLFIVTSHGFTHNPANSIDLAVGENILIRYDAILQPSVRGGVDLVNEVDVEWTSLDDNNPTDGGTALDPDERTGDGDIDNPADPTNPNNYEDASTATFRTDLTYGFTKEVFSTSAEHTGTADGIDNTTDLTIGETVVYRLTATLGRGTTDQVQIIDQLAIANGLLDIRNVTVQAGSSLTRADGQAFDNNVTVSDSLGTDGYNDRLIVDFGTVINDPTGSTGAAGEEQIVILIEAVVVNNLANQDGDVINNRGDLNYLLDVNGDGTQTAQNINDNVDVEIVEPTLTVDKNITSAPANPDGGDTVVYEVIIRNTSDINAFGVLFQDELADDLTIDPSTFTATLNSTGGNVAGGFSIDATNGVITQSGSGFTLEGNDFITIRYEVTIDDTVVDGQTFDDEVDIEYSSLPGDTDDERTGDGDYDNPPIASNPDDYESEDSTTFTANFVGYAFDKSITTTSAEHTGTDAFDPTLQDLTIGETVTYALTATLVEGTTQGVVIDDIFQITDGILDIESVNVVGGSNLTFGAVTPSLLDNDFDTYRERVIANIGTVVNNGESADAAADQITVYVTARVVNVTENQAGDVVRNDASLSYLEDQNNDGEIDDGDTPTVIRDFEQVEIVEPQVTVEKVVNEDEPKLGETLTYTLTFTNPGRSSTADAFDVEILDRLANGLALDTGSIQLNIEGTPANPSTIIANTSDTQNLRLVLDRLDEGARVTVTYNAVVTSDIAFFEAVLPNQVDIEWSTLPGTDPTERGGDGDPDADPTGPNDYEDRDREVVEVHQPDLAITKVDNDESFRPGSEVTYDIQITNQGRATALGVSITDDISDYLRNGFQFVSATGGGTLDPLTGVVTWPLPDMAVDDVNSVSITLKAPSIIPAGLETITNTAVANHTDIEPTPVDNEAPEPTPVIASPDLTVTKTDGLTFARQGQVITYTITYDNVGDQIASGVQIVDTLPPGVQFISASGGGNFTGNSVVWNIASLTPGGGSSLQVTVRVVTPGTKINEVTITDDGTGGADPTPHNNEDEDITIATPTPDPKPDPEPRPEHETDPKGDLPDIQFDLNQNFLFESGNRSDLSLTPGSSIGQTRDQLKARYPFFDFPEDTQIPVIYGGFMNSGLAQPGSTITLEVYSSSGRLLGQQSVMADSGGNWLASFPMDGIEEQPSRVVMRQTWSTHNPVDNSGYNFRTYFAPTFASSSYYSEDLTVWNVTEKRAASEVLDLVEASKNVLQMDWNGTSYDLAARGALQSSSGN